MIVAVVMLSQLHADTPYWYAALSMFVMGSGLGFTMQVLVIAVQNSVDRTDMGVATSSVQFFRQMGGSFGAALFGAILSSRLAVHLAEAAAGPRQARCRRALATSATTSQAINGLCPSPAHAWSPARSATR